jgi:two-component system, cell cycle response regulator
MSSSSRTPAADSGGDKTTVLESETTLNQEMRRAKEQDACLIIIRGTPQGHRFFITAPEMTIGRDPATDISVSDQSVSRKHAQIRKEADGRVRLTDLGSQNGTFVNDKKLAGGNSVILAKEDMIKLGNSIFKYLPAGELETLYLGNLSDAAHTDPLTRIYNKGFLLEGMEAEIKRAKALHTGLSVLFLDLDHFKKINDTYGHDAGDHVLKEFTNLVRTSYLRPKDVFGRYGGEEFVVVLGNMGAKAALELAERIRCAVEAHAFIYEGKKIAVTTSMGIAELGPSLDTVQALLKASDKALYQSKQTGRNKITVAG